MIVCHCHALSDRTIRETVRAGACTLDEVGDACGAGTTCGGCHDAIAGVIDAERGPLVHLRLQRCPADFATREAS